MSYVTVIDHTGPLGTGLLAETMGLPGMSRQLDRLEQKVEELTSLVGSMAWYYEETLDQLAFIVQRLEAIEKRLGIGVVQNIGGAPAVEHRDPVKAPYDIQ